VRSWKKGLAWLAALLVLVAIFGAPYVASYEAAHQATQAAIKSAQAAQNTQQAKAQLANVAKAERNIQTVVNYIQTLHNDSENQQVQKATAVYLQAQRTYAADLAAICKAVGCKP
jgi:archaellum component FlaF (FlaF/FlaG flagellin family)